MCNLLHVRHAVSWDTLRNDVPPALMDERKDAVSAAGFIIIQRKL